ncbi:MAG: hypothetical protein V2A76_10560 [Planctomycetota bacterium]
MRHVSADRVLVMVGGAFLCFFILVNLLSFRSIASSRLGTELVLESTPAETSGSFFAALPAEPPIDPLGQFRFEPTDLHFKATVFFANHELATYQDRKSREDRFQGIAPPLNLRFRKKAGGILLEWAPNPVNTVIQQDVADEPQLRTGYRIYRWREGQEPKVIATDSLDSRSFFDQQTGPQGGRLHYSVLAVLEGRIGDRDTLIESRQSEVLKIDLEEGFALRLVSGDLERVIIEITVGTEANPYSARFEVASGDSIGTLSGVDGEDGVRTVDFGTGLIVKEIEEVNDSRDEVIQHPLFNPDGSRASDETGYLIREEVREIPVQRLEVRCEGAGGEIRILSLDLE